MTALLGVMIPGGLAGHWLGDGTRGFVFDIQIELFLPCSVLGKLPGEEVYRDVTRRHDAQTVSGGC